MCGWLLPVTPLSGSHLCWGTEGQGERWEEGEWGESGAVEHGEKEVYRENGRHQEMWWQMSQARRAVH